MIIGWRDALERRKRAGRGAARWGGARGWGRAGAAAILAAGVAVALVVSLGSPSSGYRTAVARDAAVVKAVAVTGTVEPVDRVTLSFGVAGTVATVAVHVGERVTAGQTLATLATTALNLQVRQDQATLLAAQATVAADEKSQSAGASAGSGGSGAGGGTSTSAGAGGGAGPGTTTGSGSATTLQGAQQAVVAAQKTADSAEQAASSALSTADTACGTVPETGTQGGSSAGAGTGSATAGAPRSATATGAGAGTAGTACTTALHQALGAQETVATDQQAVTQAETALATVLAKGGSETGATTRPTTGATATGATTRPTTGATATGATSSGGGASATTAKAEAAQLAGDQASVDTADATLLEAQQSLAEADLTSPIAGTVGAIDLASGQTASTGSGTPAVTILTRHTFEAEGLVDPTQVPALAVGDAVHVTVDGRPSPIAGDVTRIGPVDTSLGDEYPVIVALPAGIPRLFTGSLCQMTVVLHVASRALAVPTSAVHTAHGHSYVTVLDNGKPHRTDIAVGIVGTRDTQVLSGLRSGEHVVLATLTRPLPKPPNSSSGSTNRNFPIFRGAPPGAFFVTPTGRGSVTIYHAG